MIDWIFFFRRCCLPLVHLFIWFVVSWVQKHLSGRGRWWWCWWWVVDNSCVGARNGVGIFFWCFRIFISFVVVVDSFIRWIIDIKMMIFNGFCYICVCVYVCYQSIEHNHHHRFLLLLFTNLIQTFETQLFFYEDDDTRWYEMRW